MGEKVSDHLHTGADRGTVWQIVADIASYPEWIEGITGVQVLATNDDGTVHQARFQVDAKVLEVEYVLEYQYDDYDIIWSLVEGETVSQLDGRYSLREDNDGVRVGYDLEIDVDLPVPGFLKKRAARTILDQGLAGLKVRAEAG